MDNGFEFARLNGYIVYQFNDSVTGSYYLCMPDSKEEKYDLFISFPNKDLKTSKKEDIIADINRINEMITSVNKSAIYALPMIPVNELEEASMENDDRAFQKLLDKYIQPMTRDIYKKLTSSDVKEQSINQVINIVSLTESDKKFIFWLETKMGDFVKGMNLSELRKYYDERVAMNKEATDSRENIPVLEEEDKTVEKTSIAPFNHEYENEEQLKDTKSHVKVRRLLPPNANKIAGFTSLASIIVVLMLALALGIGAAYLLIK